MEGVRRVLIICYYFPPLGLAGVTRPVQLFKRLATHGYECHVLTVKPVAYYAYEPELIAGEDQTRIHRAGSYDTQRLMHLCRLRRVSDSTTTVAQRLKSSVFPDSKRGWIGPAARLGLRLMKDQSFNLLVSTSPPISAHLVASRLNTETGVKWVADFRDLWTTDSIESSYANAHLIEKGRALLGDIRARATSMTAVNRSIAEYVGAPNVITNGLDPETAKLWSAEADSGRFVVGLLGTFNDQLPVEPLLKCLAVVRDSRKEMFDRVRLVQVGRVDQKWMSAWLAKYGLADRCEMHGLQSREKTVELLNGSSLFYLGVQPGWGDRITTARVYDLLASGRPILAYAQRNSELTLLLENKTNCRTFADDTISEATEFVASLVTRHSGEKQRFEPMPEYARPYSWDNVTAQFAELFDKLV
ncbi:hypothetical protein C3F09_02880 [candidate division GN15 bacterium]|uniref:Glycosyltransferase subfamily 4-like N-terminal domain-containing protein n=1 Tax=candidate division GN15 bacterium TaxID=2072418 RepID=A0A855XBS1_9BACT|nr:MAG: hypothetical protein C3F09_02880 [candidate division GN15 bacterium]